MVKRLLILTIGISILVSGFVLYGRYRAEKRVSNVEIAIDMNDFQDLAGEMGIDFGNLAQQLKNRGATSIAVQEVTLLDLKNRGHIAYMPLSDLLMGYYTTGTRVPVAQEIITRLGDKIDKREASNYSIVITKDRNMYDFLYIALSKRTNGNVDRIEIDDSYAIIIKKKLRNLSTMGLGFLDRDLQFAKDLDFLNLIPRIQNYQEIDEQAINDKIEQVKNPRFKVSTVIFAGETVLGYNPAEEDNPVMLKYAAKSFYNNGLVAAIIEKPAEEDINKVQRGIKTFSKASMYTSTKVYSSEMDKQKIYDPNDIVEQWARAISERNVRIIYVRPILDPDKDAVQNLQDNMDAIGDISQRIKQMGLKRDMVKGLGNIYPESHERLIMFVGIGAAFLMILLTFIDIKNYIIYGLLGLGAVAVAGTAGINVIYGKDIFLNLMNSTIGDLAIKATALTSAVVFPSLASLYLINVYSKISKEAADQPISKIIMKSIITILAAAGISLLGGILIASLLAESKYMLKLDIFRGVKAAFILPLLVYAVLYIKKLGIYSDKDENPLSMSLQLKKLFNTSVTVKYAFAGALVLVALAILILRSGNAPSSLSLGVERDFRAFLESTLVARPRSKELIAFPILMLLAFSALRRYKALSFLIIFTGVIGLIDIVNSFSHIRMSLQMAVLSTIYSLTFGIAVGTILILLWNVVEKRFLKTGNGGRETH